jgi:NitT/TauT family transport system substrate-binding protein
MAQRFNFFLGAVSRVTLAVAFSAILTAPLTGAAQGLVTIRVAGTVDDAKTPLYYAIKNGLYSKAGLDVQVVVTSSGSAATTAVLTGASEMGTGSLLSVATAYLKGIPVAVVANAALADQSILNSAIVVAADSSFKTGADMNGKTVGVPALNDINTLYTSVWVDSHGGDSKTLKFVELSNTLTAEALASHRVDVACMQQPQLSAAIETGKVKLVANAAISKSPYVFSTYFVNKDWAAKHPDAVRTFARVSYAAAAYTNSHPKETTAMMAEVTKIPLAVFEKMPRFRAATTSEPSLMQPLINAAATYKQLPREFPAKELFIESVGN